LILTATLVVSWTSSTLSTHVNSWKKPKHAFRHNVQNSKRKNAKPQRQTARKKRLVVSVNHAQRRVVTIITIENRVLTNQQLKPRAPLVKSRAIRRFLTLTP